MQPVLAVRKGSDARRRYKPPARPYHLFYYTGFVNTFTENGRTFYPYPPLRGTSFHRKEGGSIHASPFPWKGLPSAARRGWLPFLAAKPPPLCLPPLERRCVEKSGILVSQPSPLGKGDRAAVDRVLSLMAYLRRSFPLSFIPPSPSNLRPFGAPPSIGRRECPREPLPLEGAVERSEAGLAFFFGGEAATTT